MTDLMTDLRAIAEAATLDGKQQVVSPYVRVQTSNHGWFRLQDKTDAWRSFIATFNPKTVLALLDVVERSREYIDLLKESGSRVTPDLHDILRTSLSIGESFENMEAALAKIEDIHGEIAMAAARQLFR